MEKEKLGEDPAFPYEDMHDKGMSKRLYIATMAMQGIMASNECGVGHIPSTVAKWAYEIADEMLKQENE